MLRNILDPDDKKLFDYMATHYQTANEKEFFERQRYKQENVLTVANDLVLSECNNEDGIYIVRCEFEEYIIGQVNVVEEQHVMCLSEALELNLKECGYLDKNMTLLQWLRERDYAGVEYNHNYDEI